MIAHYLIFASWPMIEPCIQCAIVDSFSQHVRSQYFFRFRGKFDIYEYVDHFVCLFNIWTFLNNEDINTSDRIFGRIPGGKVFFRTCIIAAMRNSDMIEPFYVLLICSFTLSLNLKHFLCTFPVVHKSFVLPVGSLGNVLVGVLWLFSWLDPDKWK